MLPVLAIAIQALLAMATPSQPVHEGRSQYFLMENDGAYKYGYATGDGIKAEQSGDSRNQVEGHYRYQNEEGQDVDLRYSAGEQGFAPTGYEELNFVPRTDGKNRVRGGEREPSSALDTIAKHRLGDGERSRGNVWGYYTFSSEAEKRAFEDAYRRNKGFVPISRSLTSPEEPKALNLEPKHPSALPSYGDGSYSYSYLTGTEPRDKPSSRRDFAANPQGSAPEDDLAGTGDASYAFTIDTDDYKRQESSDPSGRVRGYYSYRNEDGVVHDLSYEAGDNIGFVLTGGTLANPFDQAVAPNEVFPLARSFPGDDRGKNASVDAETNATTVDGFGSEVVQGDGEELGEASTLASRDSKHRGLQEPRGNPQGYFFYENPDGTHTVTYLDGSASRSDGFPQESRPGPNAVFKTQGGFSRGVSKLAPPEPVPYPQSKNAYGIDNYVVRTYEPAKAENSGKYGHYFRY